MIASGNNDLERVADQYRADGYEVAVRPEISGLPEFLRRFPLEIVARKGDQNVVVALRDRDELAGDPELSYLASELNSRPGWRLDMFITHEDVWGDDVPQDSTEPDPEQIRALAETAGRLVAQHETRAALLIAWSAIEAALRDLARRMSIELEWQAPESVLQTLFVEGVLSQEDYDGLRAALRARNAVAHGLNYVGAVPDVPQFLIDAARRMLTWEPSQSVA